MFNEYFFLFLSAIAETPQKHALIVAVSEYKRKSIIPLASEKDADVLVETLSSLGIDDKNIHRIGKKKATRAGIIAKWNALNKTLKKGDFVYIHYSGHGSQVPDVNGDEWKDRLDEVWVSYDADYKNEKLDPKTVVLDDEIEALQLETRRILGSSGQLFMTFDACHNATATRDVADKVVTRNLKTEYDVPTTSLPEPPPKKEDASLAPLISISASRDNQEAAEVRMGKESMGGLTYALKDVLPKVTPNSSYEDIFQDVVLVLQRHTPGQNPTLHGSKNSVFFKNDFVYQEPFFLIKSVKEDLVSVRAGRHLGLYEGAVVAFYPKGTRKADAAAVAEGTVVKEGLKLTIVQINDGAKKLDLDKKGEYWMFIKHKCFRPGGTKLFLEKVSGEEKKKFDTLKESMPLVTIQKEKSGADLVLSYDKGWLLRDLRYPPKTSNKKEKPETISFDTIVPKVQYVSIRQFLLDFMSQYRNKEKFTVEALQADGSKWGLNDSGAVDLLSTEGFRFRITNNTSQQLYVTLVNVDDAKKHIQQLFPNKDDSQSLPAIGVPPNKSLVYPPMEAPAPFYFYPNTEGLEQALFIAQPFEEIDFSPLNQKGDTDVTATKRSVLSAIVKMPTTRSFGAPPPPPVFRGYTATVTLDVEKDSE